MKRAGFTMIELIFVIVILGILAAVAVPKLSATRDDAKKSAELANMKNCLSNVIAEYQATATSNELNNAGGACTEAGISAGMQASGILLVSGAITGSGENISGLVSGTAVSY